MLYETKRICLPILKVDKFTIDFLDINVMPKDIIITVDSVNYRIVKSVQLL